MDRRHGWSPPERPKGRRIKTGDSAQRRDEARSASSLPNQVFGSKCPVVEKHITGALGDVLVREMARSAPAVAPQKHGPQPAVKARESVPATELAALVERVAAHTEPARPPALLDEPDVSAELAWVLMDVASGSAGRPRQVASLRLSDLIGDARALTRLGRDVLAEIVARFDAAGSAAVGNNMLLRVVRIAAERELQRPVAGVANG